MIISVRLSILADVTGVQNAVMPVHVLRICIVINLVVTSMHRRWKNER